MNPFEKYLSHEDRLQIQVLRYLANQYPKAAVHHSPNEGKRSPFERWKAGVMGVKSGFPDLLIAFNGKTIAIELKTEANKVLKIKRGTVTDNQYAWIAKLAENNIPAFIAYGYDHAKAIIDEYLKSA